MRKSEDRRLSLVGSLDPKLAQHFTPSQAAELIASFPRLEGLETVRILDPGAGSGALTAAIVERVLHIKSVKKIELVAVEIDTALVPHLDATLEECQKAAANLGVECSVERYVEDFIVLASGHDFLDGVGFDVVILNPPYGKIPAASQHRKLLQDHGLEAPNLYAAFVALGIMALKENGQLVAITPRSWANGTYFTPFRKWLIRTVSIDVIHVFDSRNTVFADTKVLQETIIFSVTKAKQCQSITISKSLAHLDVPETLKVEATAVLHPTDPNSFVRIPGDTGGEIERIMGSLPSSLTELGIKVSTGKVVDFRSRPNLRELPDPTHHALIYPVNFSHGIIEWPVLGKKPQGFAIVEEADRKMLMPAGTYVVIKRFSAKEERRRIVAAVWQNNGTEPAFENHLNVIHANGQGLDPQLAAGLCMWLNSTFVDDWFRTFSGHTQVNAGDLRTLRFPTMQEITNIGEPGIPDQEQIDHIIEPLLTGVKTAA